MGRPVLVEVMGEHVLVNPVDDVDVGIEKGDIAPWQPGARHRNPAHQNPIAHQQGYECGNLGPHTAVPKIKQGDHQVADGETLQDAVDAHVFKTEERKAVAHEPEEK